MHAGQIYPVSSGDPDPHDTHPDARVRYVSGLLDQQDHAGIQAFVQDLHAADIADILQKEDLPHRLTFLDIIGETLDPEVISHLHPDVRSDVLARLSPQQVATIVNDLEADDALDLIETLDVDIQTDVLNSLRGKRRAVLEEGLTFPEDSAGRLMQRDIVTFPAFWTVGKAVDYMRNAGDTFPEEFHSLFIVDPHHRLVGRVDLWKLVRHPRSERLGTIAEPDTHAVQATADQEDAAHLFRQYGMVVLPVIDDTQRLVGMITHDDIINVMAEEAEEDILKLAGIDETDLYRALFRTTRNRFRWLSLNLLTAVVASLAIGLFDATLQQTVALAILMPIVASMGGNAGTQTLAVVVRALATRELSMANAWRVVGKESLVGLMNGVLFAGIMAVVVGVWFGNPVIAAVIAVAMVLNLLVAGFAGALIPIVLDRMNIDPAVSSSIFLTTVTDVIGFVAFLGLATALL